MKPPFRDPFVSVQDLINLLANYPLNDMLYLCGDIYGGATLYAPDNDEIWSV